MASATCLKGIKAAGKATSVFLGIVIVKPLTDTVPPQLTAEHPAVTAALILINYILRTCFLRVSYSSKAPSTEKGTSA
jgi:hypothetical protein